MRDEDKVLTITLTGRAPVRVRRGDWPLTASASWFDAPVRGQANRERRLYVRQHADGRSIVSGFYETQVPGECGAEAGEVVQPGGDVPAAIRRVGEYVGCDRGMVDECVADLPAVEVGAPTPGSGGEVLADLLSLLAAIEAEVAVRDADGALAALSQELRRKYGGAVAEASGKEGSYGW